MQGFCDQIARQYDALVGPTQIESISSEDFLAPTRSDITHADNWLEFDEFKDETLVASKGYLCLFKIAIYIFLVFRGNK
jgi:hypothetical protein